MQCVMAELPIDLHIRDVEQTFKRAARKSKPQRMSDGTLWSITADKIFAFDDLRRAGVGAHSCGDSGLILRKTFEFGLPQNVPAVTLKVVVEKSFVFALLQDKHVRVGA